MNSENKLKKKVKCACFLVSLAVLAIGLLPYLFVRTSSTHISSFLGMFFCFKRISLEDNRLIYSLLTSFFSDFCWAFAMPLQLFAFTNGKFSKCFYVFITPAIGGMFEIFQFLGLVNGVGDIIDALIYFIASFLGWLTVERGFLKWQTNRKRKTKNRSKNMLRR